jgi:hypothetical protein
MYYIIKKKGKCIVVKAKLENRTRWVDAYGSNVHYYYVGIDEDEDNPDAWFDTRDIIKKSRAKSKQKVKELYPEYFI